MPPPNPGVVALGVLEVFFATADDFFVGPAIGTKGIAVKTLSPLLVVLAAEGLGVQRDVRDLAPTVGAVAVGREGEDDDLVSSLGR